MSVSVSVSVSESKSVFLCWPTIKKVPMTKNRPTNHQIIATHCNTLQHTSTHCTLQRCSHPPQITHANLCSAQKPLQMSQLYLCHGRVTCVIKSTSSVRRIGVAVCGRVLQNVGEISHCNTLQHYSKNES